MDSSKIVFIAVSFIVVIGLFVFSLFKFILVKPEKRTFNFEEDNEFNMETVMLVLSSKTSTIEDLHDVIDKFFANYDSIAPNKLQIKNICIAISLHRNANKDIILGTQRKLTELNPDAENEIEKAIKKGLDAR